MSGLFGSFGFGADPFGGGGGGMGGGMGGGGGGGASPGQFNMRFKAYPPSYMERDNAQVEKGDKIILPQSCLETLSRLRISYPMMFEVTNAAVGRKTHCGVLEFTAREGTVYLPKWMMDNLFLEPGSKISIRSVSLVPGTYVKLRPQSKRFLDLTNPKATLETCLRNFSALTKGDTICITHGTNQYAIDIMELKPADQVTIIETDLNVDFAPPVDHEDGIMGAASKSARDEQAALAASSKAAATEPAPAPAPEPEPEGFAGHAFAGGSQAAAPKHDAFAGQGYSLSGKTAPKKGTEVTTYDKVASEWDQCKGGISAPPDSSVKGSLDEEYDSSEDESMVGGRAFKPYSGAGHTLRAK